MQASSRLRRLNEFATWFELTYGEKLNPPTGDSFQKVLKMTLLVQKLLDKYHPKCYWCQQATGSDVIDLEGDTITLHHIDEDRNNDRVENLAVCHKTCHQRMHKTSTATKLPTMALWSLVKHGRIDAPSWNEAVHKGMLIPGVGRG